MLHICLIFILIGLVQILLIIDYMIYTSTVDKIVSLIDKFWYLRKNRK